MKLFIDERSRNNDLFLWKKGLGYYCSYGAFQGPLEYNLKELKMWEELTWLHRL